MILNVNEYILCAFSAQCNALYIGKGSAPVKVKVRH